MRSLLVYDWPTRIFHWSFAGFFVLSFAISNLTDDDSSRFPLHMLSGMAMCSVILLRLAWSLVGTRHARFSDLVLGPASLFAYFRGMFSGATHRWIGHNPASSWAAVVMVCLGLGLGVTGYLMTTGPESDLLEEAHELMANAFLVVVLLHIGGLVAHALRYRDRLAGSMVTGTKQLAFPDQPVRSRPFVGLLFVVLTALSVTYLLRHYDAQARTLELFGQTLQLDEHEKGGESAEAGEGRHEAENEHE